MNETRKISPEQFQQEFQYWQQVAQHALLTYGYRSAPSVAANAVRDAIFTAKDVFEWHAGDAPDGQP